MLILRVFRWCLNTYTQAMFLVHIKLCMYHSIKTETEKILILGRIYFIIFLAVL